MDACRDRKRDSVIRAAWGAPGRLRRYALTEMCRGRGVLRGRILPVEGLRAAAVRSALLSGTETPSDMESASLASKTEKSR